MDLLGGFGGQQAEENSCAGAEITCRGTTTVTSASATRSRRRHGAC